jgi:hypothetical protein
MTQLLCKFVSIIILATALALSVSAQPTGSIGVSFPVAKTGGNPADDLGVNFDGGYWVKDRFFVGVEAFTNDGFGSRYRATGLGRIPYNKFKFDIGAGLWCFFRCTDQIDGEWGGFGQVGLHYDRVHSFLRIGNDRFLEGELALDVARFLDDRITVQTFARGTRHELPSAIVPNLTQTIYPIGLRFIFSDKERDDTSHVPPVTAPPKCGDPCVKK